ncbi:MAG: ethanolamine permease [Planctomycetota bacterium]|nr:ethanolamine permease [Planctomycetota bacterium]MDA1212169.1 ethanolamine permease [Planctomycetota bacterium]
MSEQTSTSAPTNSTHLKKALGPVTLWGLGVGYVIAGEYMGWNLGMPVGGTYGFLLAAFFITVMYVTFVFSYTEMACAIPRAGGVFVYGVRGLGLLGGYVGGVAQVIEFVFAPPAIAMTIGAYAQNWFPEISAKEVAIPAYFIFTTLNIIGVKQTAIFELIVAGIAVFGIIMFTVVAAPHFQWANITRNGWAGETWASAWAGSVAEIPFAIWLYLAIEGVANAAEEAKNPQRDVPLGFGSAILTLVTLAVLVVFFSVGIGGWEKIVYHPDAISHLDDGTTIIEPDAALLDNPLALGFKQILPEGHLLHHILAMIGVVAGIAGLNGITMAASRSLFEMGRVGFLPHFIGKTWPRTQTPANALLLNLVIGVTSILLFDTGRLVTMSALGAVMLYMVSMLALMKLRTKEPDLHRPFKTPFYPVFPIIAGSIATFSFATMMYFQFDLNNMRHSPGVWFIGFVIVAVLYYQLVVRHRLTSVDIRHFHQID